MHNGNVNLRLGYINEPVRTCPNHAMSGARCVCDVRSLTRQSHFTIALGKVEGAVLNCRLSAEKPAKYPQGVPVHELLTV